MLQLALHIFGHKGALQEHADITQLFQDLDHVELLVNLVLCLPEHPLQLNVLSKLLALETVIRHVL